VLHDKTKRKMINSGVLCRTAARQKKEQISSLGRLGKREHKDRKREGGFRQLE